MTDNTRRIAGLSPQDWKLLEQIEPATEVPVFDGTFNGKNYQGKPENFIKFIEENLLAKDFESGKYAPVHLAGFQRKAILNAFAVDAAGRLLNEIVFFIWPKRHGKTQLLSYYDLYRFCNFEFQEVGLIANSEAQVRETSFKWIVDTLLNSPLLKAKVDRGLIRITQDEIENLETKSRIIPLTSAAASAHGLGLTTAHISEGHAAKDKTQYVLLSGATGAEYNGITLGDSHVGEESNYVYEKVRDFRDGTDPALYVNYIAYKNLKEALKKSPVWIRKSYLKSRHVDLSSMDFDKYHLNKPIVIGDLVFDPVKWRAASVEDEQNPLMLHYLKDSVFKRYENEWAYFGAGLDRGGRKKDADRTILTLVCKGFLKPKYTKKQAGERSSVQRFAEVRVIDQVEIPSSDDDVIKEYLEAWWRLYRITAFAPEEREVQDLVSWCERVGIPCEPLNPRTRAKEEAVGMMEALVEKRRFFYPGSLYLLREEGTRYKYNGEAARGKKYGYDRKFEVTTEIDGEDKKLKIKDDSVDALICAVWGLRKKVQPPFKWTGSQVGIGLPEGGNLIDSFAETR